MTDGLFWIEDVFDGRLATMARPRGGDWLAEEIEGLRRAGVDLVVSLLEQEEMRELKLLDERRLCEEKGIGFLSLPVPDYGVPSRAKDFNDAVSCIVEALKDSKTVAVHCRMGIGRSSLLAAAVLVFSGLGVGEAFDRISTARGLRVPDTDEQRHWLEWNAFALLKEAERGNEGEK